MGNIFPQEAQSLRSLMDLQHRCLVSVLVLSGLPELLLSVPFLKVTVTLWRSRPGSGLWGPAWTGFLHVGHISGVFPMLQSQDS